MGADVTDITSRYGENGGNTCQDMQQVLDQTSGIDMLVQIDKKCQDEKLLAGGLGKANENENGTELSGNSVDPRPHVGLSSDELEGCVASFSLVADHKSPLKQCDAYSAPQLGSKRAALVHHSSAQDIFQLKDPIESPSPRARKGLDHCITAPVERHRNIFLGSIASGSSRSMTENKGSPLHDLKLDRLSERDKEKLIRNLVKIQDDGTMEVDISKSAPIASELLELHPVEGSVPALDRIITDFDKSIPKLKIAMLVVGTRGDVQPFLAVAKKLQEFGHHVRLATHANFRNFVTSNGIHFFPLGGDPRILAGYMARNKGLLSSSPGEISIQRKQLQAIIHSLLPACTEPDIETGESFRAQAIIANPPAYGNDLEEIEKLKKCLCSEFDIKSLGKLRYMQNPRECHWQIVERILGYLKSNPGSGILFQKHDKMNLEIFTDADYAGCVDDKKSTSGYCTYLGGNMVTWRSKKQNVVTRSSAEAEFRAMATGICELIWIKIILEDLKIQWEKPMKLYCDNKSTINIAHNPVQHDRTKHIEVDRHFIKEKIESGLICTPFIQSKGQLADIFTKALPSKLFHDLKSKLGMSNPYSPA